MINQVIQGDCLEVMKRIPDKSIDMAITSPPYWGLRSYGTNFQIWGGDDGCEHRWGEDITIHRHEKGETNPGKEGWYKEKGQINSVGGNFCQMCGAWKGELGLEPTFDGYISHLIQIFSEVKRVLKDEGTCWVNIGDTYSGSGCGTNDYITEKSRSINKSNEMFSKKPPQQRTQTIPAKSLCGIPERFAIAMTDKLGFIRRNTLIWFKRNCIPSSATDRFTVDFEYLYFFSKQGKYYFEQQFEPLNFDTLRRTQAKHSSTKSEQLAPAGFSNEGAMRYAERLCSGEIPQSRNKRCVWEINTTSYRGAHFATFPEGLVQTPILAGCPEFICNKCGKARKKIFHKQKFCYTDCGCGDVYHSGIVLDPFMGSGTTALVALKLNRHFIGIELNENYIKMANERIRQEKEKQSLFLT